MTATPATTPVRERRRNVYHALIQTTRPLTRSQQGLLVYDDPDTPPYLTTAWHPAPGPRTTSGVLTVHARDATAAAEAVDGLMYIATGRGNPYQVAAVIRDGTCWPPAWWGVGNNADLKG